MTHNAKTVANQIASQFTYTSHDMDVASHVIEEALLLFEKQGAQTALATAAPPVSGQAGEIARRVLDDYTGKYNHKPGDISAAETIIATALQAAKLDGAQKMQEAVGTICDLVAKNPAIWLMTQSTYATMANEVRALSPQEVINGKVG